MKHVNKLILGMALLVGMSMSFAQDYSDYTNRTVNIQPLIPYAGLQTDYGADNGVAGTINASQTTPYGQTYAQQGIAVNDYKVQELEARIANLEAVNADAQNRIAALEASHNSLANQLANVSQTNPSITTPATPASSGSSYLQVGAFSRVDLATQLVYKLQQLGYQVYDSASSTGVTKLFIGPFANSLIPDEQYRLSLQNIVDSFPIAVP